MDFKIRKGEKKDAAFLAQTVMCAIGNELCEGLADGKENIPKVGKLFLDLAARDDSQYSYKNALIAEDNHGNPVGAIIAYDGERLLSLRKAFIEKANELLKWNVTEEDAEKWEPEASPDEIYLDSLFVRPEYRKQGLATALFQAVFDKFKDAGKPFGLLVARDNDNAKRLYENLGFKKVGMNNFCGEPMHHMQKV